jgi:hypothetical protein
MSECKQGLRNKRMEQAQKLDWSICIYEEVRGYFVVEIGGAILGLLLNVFTLAMCRIRMQSIVCE